MRYLLSLSFLCLCINANAKALDLDFVPYDDLSDSQKGSVSKSCSGKFVDNFFDYTNDVDDEGQLIKSDNQSFNDQTWILDGNASIVEKSLVLLSDSIQYNQNTSQSSLTGDTQLRFNGLMLQGETAQMNLDAKTGVVKNAKFIIHSSNVNGTAKEIRRDEDGVFHLTGFTISKCNPDQKSWWFKGSKLTINPNTGMISSTHNFLWVGGIPVFYTPYIHMPYDDHATSGFLVATFAFKPNGAISEYNQPIYFRIKPNFDLTSTISYLTKSYLKRDANGQIDVDSDPTEKAGLLVNNEFRFLGLHHEGTFQAAYSNMPSHHVSNLPSSDRYYFNYSQKWDFDWFTSSLDFNLLSDEYFLSDFYSGEVTNSSVQTISNVYKIEDSVIDQKIIASRALENSSDNFHLFKHELHTKELGWDIFYKQHWQDYKGTIVIDDNDTQNAQNVANSFNFLVSPAFEAKYQSKNLSFLNLNQNVTIHIANFDRQLPSSLVDMVEISEQLRLAIKAQYSKSSTLKIADTDATYQFNPSLLIQGALYPGFEVQEDQEQGYINAYGSVKQTFNIPTAINESDQILWKPELIWQYAPFEDSSYLPVLDSENTTPGYGNSIRFSGFDRLGDTNEIHYGLALEYQKNKQSLAKFSINQSQLFEQELLNLQSVNEVNDEFERFSDYSVKASFNPNSRVDVSGNWNFTPEFELHAGEMAVKYLLPDNRYLRFTSYSGYGVGESEHDLISRSLSLSGQAALNHQIGLIGYGKWQYDVNNEDSQDYQFEELAIGLEFDDCCWAVRMLSYTNFLDEEDSDNRIHFQIIFKGMGRLDQGFDAIVDKYLPAYPGSLFEQD